MRLQDKNAIERAKGLWQQASFINKLGIELEDIKPGETRSRLQVKDWQGQAEGYVHAGVIATMADHSCGCAGGTLVRADEIVLTIEFKVNLLRPATGEALICFARVIKPGKTIIVCEAEVFSQKRQREKLVAKTIVTLAVVADPQK